ncbi:homoprotocatechuate degradation operon regulator HpaR [Roseibium salinum]|nr:homoprotocatechuate degradation operon regulator HpaR [Roseibium salinum]
MAPIREMLQESGISEQQWRILRVVDEAGEIEQTAIAQGACLQLPSLTRILRSMEADGFISRRNDEADRRRTLVSVTENGRSLIADHQPRNAEIFKRLEAEFGREKLEQLLDLLEDLQKVRF